MPVLLQPHVAVPAERWPASRTVASPVGNPRPVDQAGYKRSLCILRADSGLWWLEYGLWSLVFHFLKLRFVSFEN